MTSESESESSIYAGLSPSFFGLPEKFKEFRPAQLAAIEYVVYGTTKRFVALCLPTGSGKTGVGIAIAKALGVKTIYHTATRALQDQVGREMREIGMVDVRGRANYKCAQMYPGRKYESTCEYGHQHECSLERTPSCGYTAAVLAAQEADLAVDNYSYWMHARRYNQSALAASEKPIELMICDECFVAGTLIDGRDIATLHVGDYVQSYGGGISQHRVVRKLEHKPKALVRLRLSNGKTIICTPDHPFMTVEGDWRGAALTVGYHVVSLADGKEIPEFNNDRMHGVRGTDGFDRHETEISVSEDRQVGLFSEVQDSVVGSRQEIASGHRDELRGMRQPDDDNRYEEEISISEIGQDSLLGQMQTSVDTAACSSAGRDRGVSPKNVEPESSGVQRSVASQAANGTSGNGVETASAGRKWQRTDSSAVATSVATRMGNGSFGQRKTQAGWFPFPLQTGYRPPDTFGWNRGERIFAQVSGPQGTGQEEARFFEVLRVDSVEFLEQTSDGTFGGLCPGGLVYNIEVEGPHNYFAEGILVHNCGEIPELISDFVSIKISHDDEELPILAPRRDVDLPSGLMPDKVWTTWARERGAEAAKQMARIAESYSTKAAAMKDDRYEYLVELVKTCERIPGLDSNWVWEVDSNGVRFQPIWPGQMASALWSGVPRIILMSATLRPYTLGLLGIKESEYDYREWPAVFLPQYGPVYHLPTVKLTWKSTDEDYIEMARVMDDCLDQRNDRRTLIHTGKHTRSKLFFELSRHKNRIIFNESGYDASSKADKFRAGPDNGVLMGASYTTGIDFPGRQCEFQLILKTPYPDTTSRVMTERCRNSDYRMHVTVQKLVQMVGRPRRSATDRAETVILDNGIKWAMGGPRNPWHGHAPGYFRVQTVSKLPPKPMRVQE